MANKIKTRTDGLLTNRSYAFVVHIQCSLPLYFLSTFVKKEDGSYEAAYKYAASSYEDVLSEAAKWNAVIWIKETMEATNHPTLEEAKEFVQRNAEHSFDRWQLTGRALGMLGLGGPEQWY